MKFISAVVATFLLFSPLLWADQKGESIINISQDRTRPPQEERLLEVKLFKEGQLTNIRKMKYLFLLDEGKEKTLAKFTVPNSLKNTALLLIDSGSGENKIWSYSPTNRKIRRIAGALRRNYFLGTEFTYEDFEGFRIGSRTYDYVDEVNCNTEAGCYVVDGVETEPNIVSNTGYSKRRFFIDKSTYYPVKIDYYNQENKVCKTLVSSGIKKIGGYFRPSSQYMDNKCEGRATEFVLLTIDNKTKIDAKEFTKRSLRRED